MVLQMLAIATVLNYCLLIPFDIFVTVRHTDVRLFHWKDPLIHHDWLPRMYDLYLICYILMLHLGFIFVPFQIFYVQSIQEENDLILETQIISQEGQMGGGDDEQQKRAYGGAYDA